MTNDRWNDFVNPPAKYRGAPFWAWNTKIEKEVIKNRFRFLRKWDLVVIMFM